MGTCTIFSTTRSTTFSTTRSSAPECLKEAGSSRGKLYTQKMKATMRMLKTIDSRSRVRPCREWRLIVVVVVVAAWPKCCVDEAR